MNADTVSVTQLLLWPPTGRTSLQLEPAFIPVAGLSSLTKKEKHCKRQRKYRLAHLEQCKERDRRHYIAHRKEILESRKAYGRAHLEQICKSAKKWRFTHLERYTYLMKRWRLAHPWKSAQYYRKQRLVHPDKIANSKRRYRSGPKGNLNSRMKEGISKSLRGNKRGRQWEDLVGYTVEDLKKHLESLFTDGMSWKNKGRWHIDHIVPQSFFIFDKPEDQEFQYCWSLDNLQPL